ncbi:nicotinamide mononucleotide transporter [Endozoicomonas sp.]|uniref:nicotinamide mononucleotide transporter n=1 Tax=Endozoicomonas sp. TaxID=1892382 RepID=UPI00383B313D
MDLILQIWGGAFYLINKILFALSEGKHGKTEKQLKVSGWSIYILGVPAWVIILVGHQNWIAAAIEAGGIPAMLLGLYNTYHDHKRPHKAFNIFVILCTYSSLAFGLIYSLSIHGGITSVSQVLEVGVMSGFLMGSYFMAKNNPDGWLFFMLMNLSMASLMFLQEKPILMGQQLLSLCFVLYGFNKTRKR